MMEKESDGQLIIMKESIEYNKQEVKYNKKDSDETMTKFTEQFKAIITAITGQINTLESSPTHKDPPEQCLLYSCPDEGFKES